MPPRLTALLCALLALPPAQASAQTTYGAGVTLETATPFSRVQGRPNSLEGQTIRVDGVISAVCGTPGCGWVAVAGSGGSEYGNSVFVRIDPGKIAIPKDAAGRRISVQGVMESVARDPQPGAKDIAADYAQANTGGVQPAWQLKATGAVVQ